MRLADTCRIREIAANEGALCVAVPALVTIPAKKMVPVKAKTPAFCHDEEVGCADVRLARYFVLRRRKEIVRSSSEKRVLCMQSGSEKLDFLRILVQKNLVFLIIQFRKTEHLMTA